ncbi:hypothetical protein ID866_3766 [Astraeus odoratus]|nr:hypothetical protein ID866_3766 [Astraeus odoratus]
MSKRFSIGSLSTGQGTRFVLADTEHLHQKIAEMGQRIRQLEDALSITQSSTSSDVHPLLTEDLLAIKYGPEAAPPSRYSAGDQHNVPVDALGTLTITDCGESNYFGRSAGVETLFLAGAELGNAEIGSGSSPEDELPQVSSEIAELVSILPFGLGGFPNTEKARQLLGCLFDLLPPYPRATTLCETYMENAAWIFRPISREELIDEILVPTYSFAKQDPRDRDVGVSPHTLSVLYMVFAHGALTDLTLPAYNSEAENYFHLGRLALSLHPVLDLPTAQTLQALCLMAYYHSNSGRRYTLDSAWSLISLANKIAQGMGLHRDPARFNLTPKLIQRRRTLFWEIFAADLFHVIVGTIAVKAPSSTMAPAARMELDLACDLFRKGAAQSPRARNGLPILNRLKGKADQAQAQYLSSGGSSGSAKSTALLPETGGDDELAMFGGQTRILVSKILSRQNRTNLRPSSSALPFSTPSSPRTVSDGSHSPAESVPEVHPSLVEYLSMLPPPSSAAMSATDMMPTGTQAETSLNANFHPTLPMKSTLLTFPHDMPSQAPCMPPDMQSGYDPNISGTTPEMGFFDMQYGGSMSRPHSDGGEFDLMLSGDSGMNERWMSFMRESGIFGSGT